MRYVEAPHDSADSPSLFLAGGITNCPDWQAEFCGLVRVWCATREELGDAHAADLTLLNPRRASFPIEDPDAAVEQITWERMHLVRADVISFWFCAATLCPITLFELGTWIATDKPIVVGCEPGYAREPDVRIQMSLIRPNDPIATSIPELVTAALRQTMATTTWDVST